MRKIITFIVVVLFIISLSSCTKLPQDYFTNETRDSVDDALVLFETYVNHLKEYYEETYPNVSDFSYITLEDGYQTVTPYDDEYHRDDLVNYAITNHTSVLAYNDMARVLEQVDDIILFMNEECAKLKEGTYCESENNENLNLMFQMEEDELVVEYVIEELRNYTTVTLHFKTEEEKVILEFDLELQLKSEDHIRSFARLHYKEDDYEKSSIQEEIPGGYVSEINHDLENNKFYRTIKRNGYYYLWYYVDGEQYHVTTTDEIKDSYTTEGFNYFTYTLFNGNKKVYEYSKENEEFFINLLELPGWDRLVIDDNNFTYTLYNGIQEIDNLTARVEFDHGEYVYVNTCNPFDIGLDMPFTLTLIDDKEEYITENFISIIDESGFPLPGIEE